MILIEIGPNSYGRLAFQTFMERLSFPSPNSLPMTFFRFFSILIYTLLFCVCTAFAQEADVQTIAKFRGQQVTGVTVSEDGRVFVNFPRWREGVKFSVAELDDYGRPQPYPNPVWNRWEIGNKPPEVAFMAVQSVVASGNRLYVLDTRNPLFQGVEDRPRVIVFDLKTNQVVRTYFFDSHSYYPNSYINDLRIDPERKVAYFTDSNEPGLIVLDLETGENRRLLDHHESTTAELDKLVIDGKDWPRTVHTDGIALSPDRLTLYYHSLTGYNLYAVPTAKLLDTPPAEVRESVELITKTAAPDGMIVDAKGNLYFADLENHKIQYLTPEGEIKTLVEGEEVRWADTFSIHDGYLYYTNSRIHEVGPDNVNELVFSVKRVQLAEE